MIQSCPKHLRRHLSPSLSASSPIPPCLRRTPLVEDVRTFFSLLCAKAPEGHHELGEQPAFREVAMVQRGAKKGIGFGCSEQKVSLLVGWRPLLLGWRASLVSEANISTIRSSGMERSSGATKGMTIHWSIECSDFPSCLYLFLKRWLTLNSPSRCGIL